LQKNIYLSLTGIYKQNKWFYKTALHLKNHKFSNFVLGKIAIVHTQTFFCVLRNYHQMAAHTEVVPCNIRNLNAAKMKFLTLSIQPSSLHSVFKLLMHVPLESIVMHCYTINDTSVVEQLVPVIGSITELIPVCTQIWICFKYKSSLYILIFLCRKFPTNGGLAGSPVRSFV